MELRIKNDGCSYRAELTIDGKTVTVTLNGVEGLMPLEAELTLGGLIALGLARPIIKLLQAEAAVAEEMGEFESRSVMWRSMTPGERFVAEQKLFQ